MIPRVVRLPFSLSDSPTLRRLNNSPVARAALVAALVISFMLLYARGLTRSFEYGEGTIWNDEDLIASFAFPVYRAAGIVEEEQAQAIRSTATSFDRDVSVPMAAKDTLRKRIRLLIPSLDGAATRPAMRDARAAFQRAGDSLARAYRGDAMRGMFSARHWALLCDLRAHERTVGATRDSLRQLTALCIRVADAVYARGYIDRPKKSLPLPRIGLSNGTVDELQPVDEFHDADELPGVVAAAARERAGDSTLAETATLIVVRTLKPNIVYNAGRTQLAMRAATDRVPRTEGIVKQNERIISRHERVTGGIKAKLDSYQRALIERSGDASSFLQYLGKAGHATAILLLLGIYLYLFRPRIWRNNSSLLLISLLLLFEGALARFSFSTALPGPVQYLILVPVASMLATIIFDSRVAFYTTVTAAFLVGSLRGNDYSIVLASTLAGTLSIYTVRDIRNRTQIFRSLLYIFLGYGFAIVVEGLQRALPMAAISSQLLYALVNAVLSPVITFGGLIFIERVFGVSTDLTLLELSDFNQPLLRLLSSRAPGTFHHSVVMGTLAEAAAASIGANAILARVGAYYHDVGKSVEPETYIENRRGAGSVHDTLTPRESAARIRAHVKQGIELAREYGLPERVIEFIPAHHGTTLVAFFYERERAAAGAEADADLFRYAGPLPSSKEAAIVMLADTVEASARALEEPTVDTIVHLIDSVVTRRLQEGQLAASDMTFRDLTAVKESFRTILTGIHHNRIKYPTPQEAEAAGKQAERTARLLHLPTAAEALLKRMKDADRG